MRRVVILGATGSIGTSALRVVAAHPDELRVVGLAAHDNYQALVAQARQFGVKQIALASTAAARAARSLAPELTVLEGDLGVAEMAGTGEANIVLCALVGLAGLRPVLQAMQSGKDVALATKEVLVAAGALTMAQRATNGVRILPVDSEHNAIFQCLQAAAYGAACVRSCAQPDKGQRAEEHIERLILTASGGPFANRPEIDFSRVTVAQALNHPRWSMGRKVTIDSATMMNKGLELLEAMWLFNVAADHIEIVVHPQSVVHSLVTFKDSSTLAQLSPPDMRLAIQNALTWPRRLPGHEMPALNLPTLGSLTFAEPDEQRSRAWALARAAAKLGGTYPAVLNGANEVAVEAFLAERITFDCIATTVDAVLQRHSAASDGLQLDAIVAADAWARRQAQAIVAQN